MATAAKKELKAKAPAAPEAIPIWRHPHMTWKDKLFAYIIYFTDFLGTGTLGSIAMPPDALGTSRAKVTRAASKAFESEKAEKRWIKTRVEVPRPDGTTLEIILLARRGEEPSAWGVPLVIWLHGGGLTVGTHKDGNLIAYANGANKAAGARAVCTPEPDSCSAPACGSLFAPAAHS